MGYESTRLALMRAGVIKPDGVDDRDWECMSPPKRQGSPLKSAFIEVRAKADRALWRAVHLIAMRAVPLAAKLIGVSKRSAYQGTPCGYCGRTMGNDLTIDHIVPRAAGGKSTPGNVIAVCKACNQSKGSMPLEVWRNLVAGGGRFYFEDGVPRGLKYGNAKPAKAIKRPKSGWWN
jgi:5-methylcytosine-specific restriction endonuclease McrA